MCDSCDNSVGLDNEEGVQQNFVPHHMSENWKPLQLIGSPSCERPAVVNKGNVDFGAGDEGTSAGVSASSIHL